MSMNLSLNVVLVLHLNVIPARRLRKLWNVSALLSSDLPSNEIEVTQLPSNSWVWFFFLCSPQVTDLEAIWTLLAASGVFLASNCLFLVYGIMHEYLETIEDDVMNPTQRSLIVLFDASVPLLFVIYSSANFPALYFFSKQFRKSVAALRSQWFSLIMRS